MVYTLGMDGARAESYWSRLGRMAGVRAGGRRLYERAHYLAAEMPVDPRAARRWLPRSLGLASPARATLFLAWFPWTSFGSAYREAGLFLHVRHLGVRAVCSPWMIVDDDVALVTGRELLGYPKKLGAIELEIDGDSVAGRASRRGAELFTMRGRLSGEVADPPPILGRPHRNVRGAMGAAIPKLLAFTPREEVVSVRRAELEVTVRGSERDPLHELGLGPVSEARLHVVHLSAGAPPVPIGAVSPLWYARQWLLRAH